MHTCVCLYLFVFFCLLVLVFFCSVSLCLSFCHANILCICAAALSIYSVINFYSFFKNLFCSVLCVYLGHAVHRLLESKTDHLFQAFAQLQYALSDVISWLWRPQVGPEVSGSEVTVNANDVGQPAEDVQQRVCVIDVQGVPLLLFK